MLFRSGLPDRDSAGTDHQQHGDFCALYHPLYNQGRYREARALLEEWGEAGAASTEKALEGIRSAMTEEELEIYDPLEAYRQLVDWLE